jgi:hypothetical protein
MMGSQVDILYSKDRQIPVIDYRRIKSEKTENTGKDKGRNRRARKYMLSSNMTVR